MQTLAQRLRKTSTGGERKMTLSNLRHPDVSRQFTLGSRTPVFGDGE